MSKQSFKIIVFLLIISLIIGVSFIKFLNINQLSMEKKVCQESFIVDVRTAEEFAEGSCEGAVNIPLDQVPTQLAQFEGKNNIIVFCRSGNRSAQAKLILEQNGITNVINGGTVDDVCEILNN